MGGILGLIMGGSDMQTILLSVITLGLIMVTCFPIHEFAHAAMARALGDRTAESMGRLTINPFAHLDPVGSVVMLLFGIGWAKPVPTNPVNYRKVSMRAGMALVALAGPFSNIIMGLIFMIVLKIGFLLSWNVYVLLALSIIVKINLYLAFFNLIPIPPLDGSKILLVILKEKTYFKFMRYERYFFPILFILMSFGVFSGLLDFIVQYVLIGFDYMTFFLGYIYV